MKILIITNSIVPFSGWGRYSLGVINSLKGLGYAVKVATDAGDASVSDIVLSHGRSVFSFIKNLHFIRKQSAYYDVVHALDGWPYGVYGYAAVLGTGKKLFINGVGTYSVAPLTHWFKGFLLRLAYRRAEKVFCISTYVEKAIRSLAPYTNTLVVYLGATNLKDLVTQDKILIREKLSLKDSSPVFLTVGAIKHRKGQLTSLKALKELKSLYPDFVYILVGSGDDVEYVKQIRQYAVEHNLQDNLVIKTEVRSDEELAKIYTAADVFLLNSENGGGHFEGFGLVIIEAALFGVPSVGSMDCGIEDAIKDGTTGYLAKQRDPSDISSKIKMLLERKEEMGRNSMNFAKNFSWNNTILAYERQYKKI